MRAGSTVCCGVVSRPGWAPASPKLGLGESSGGSDSVDGHRNGPAVSLVRMGEAILRPAEPRETVLLPVVVGPLVAGHMQPIRKRHPKRVSWAHQECRSRERYVTSQGIDSCPADDQGDGLAVSARSSAPLTLRSILGSESPLVLGEGVGGPGLPDRVRAARKHENGTRTTQREHDASTHWLHQESSPSADSRSRYSSVVSSPWA